MTFGGTREFHTQVVALPISIDVLQTQQPATPRKRDIHVYFFAKHAVTLLPLLLAADKKEHPECHYSMSSQKECSSTNGNFACETIRRVFRNCPGSRPEQVYDITTKDSGTIPKPPGGGDGGSDGGIPVLGGRAQQPVSCSTPPRDQDEKCHVDMQKMCARYTTVFARSPSPCESYPVFPL